MAALPSPHTKPTAGVAASLNKNGTAGGASKGFAEDDLRKLNFKELAERFEHLSQILPDALRCVQEVKELQVCGYEGACVCVRLNNTLVVHNSIYLSDYLSVCLEAGVVQSK